MPNDGLLRLRRSELHLQGRLVEPSRLVGAALDARAGAENVEHVET